MTIQELYAEIGGNYEHALKIMKMDKMINRYILKLKSSHVYEELMKAGETLDPKAMFESAHAMNGWMKASRSLKTAEMTDIL